MGSQVCPVCGGRKPAYRAKKCRACTQAHLTAGLPERHRQKILSLSVPEPNSGCWLWLGRLNPDGYGGLGHKYSAHRVSHEVFSGPVPEGKEIDHICGVRCCVNPQHLRAVTHRENIYSSKGPAALCRLKTACVRGHPLSGANLVRTSQGKRQCRTCQRFRQQKADRKRRAKLRLVCEAA